MTRILVVEDERTLADALEIAIDVQTDLECVGAVGTVEEAMPIVADGRADVVLMDVHLPGVDGITGIRRVKADHPETRVLILTGDGDAALSGRAAEAGAAGFLAKDTPVPDILRAIRAPRDARLMVERRTLGPPLRDPERRDRNDRCVPREPEGRGRCTLSRREMEVLQLMGQGLDPATIAERLGVSAHTARSHVKHIMTKLQAHSQLQAVVAAIRTGLLPGTGGG